MFDYLTLLVCLPCFMYGVYYIMYQSSQIARNAATLIPALSLSVYTGLKLLVGLITWNYSSILYIVLDVVILACATNIFTNMTEDQEDFLNAWGVYIVGALLFILLGFCAHYMYKIHGLPNMLGLIPFGLFLHFLCCAYNKTQDPIGAFVISVLLLIPYYLFETLIIIVVDFAYKFALTHLFHTVYAVVGIAALALLILYIRLWVLQGTAPPHIHLIVCIAGGLFYYIVFMIAFYVLKFAFT